MADLELEHVADTYHSNVSAIDLRPSLVRGSALILQSRIGIPDPGQIIAGRQRCNSACRYALQAQTAVPSGFKPVLHGP